MIDYAEQPAGLVAPRRIDDARALLVTCPYFAMERWDLAAPLDAATAPESFEILTTIDGAVDLAWEGGARRLARGESIVLPACLGAYRLSPEGSATLLRCFVP